jgi:hypothetical protein
MSDRQLPRAARVLVPVGAVALAFGGFAVAQAATDSGTDSPHDVAERGLDPAHPPVDDDTPTTTAAPNPASPADPSAASDTVDLPDGTTQTFPAAAAGTVTIGRSGTTLTVVAVGTNPGWTSVVERRSGPEVDVEFRNGTARVDLEAELEDGSVQVRVREDTAAPDDDATGPEQEDNRGPGSVSSGPGSVDSGHDGGDDGVNHDVGDDSGSHSGSSSDSSDSSGSGSGHSGSDD